MASNNVKGRLKCPRYKGTVSKRITDVALRALNSNEIHRKSQILKEGKLIKAPPSRLKGTHTVRHKESYGTLCLHAGGRLRELLSCNMGYFLLKSKHVLESGGKIPGQK